MSATYRIQIKNPAKNLPWMTISRVCSKANAAKQVKVWESPLVQVRVVGGPKT